MEVGELCLGPPGGFGIYPGPEGEGGSGLQAGGPRLLLAYSPPLGSGAACSGRQGPTLPCSCGREGALSPSMGFPSEPQVRAGQARCPFAPIRRADCSGLGRTRLLSEGTDHSHCRAPLCPGSDGQAGPGRTFPIPHRVVRPQRCPL